MVGTDGDGQLTATAPSSTSRVRFALAASTDDPAIRRLLRDNPMRGAIPVTFEREPDYFLGARIGGADDQTIVAFEDDRLVCMGRCTTRAIWLNGSIRRVGYLAELRLDAAATRRFEIVRDGYRFFRRLQQTNPADLWFTSIASDNTRARRLLERGLPGLPRYTHLGDVMTLLISTRRSRLPWIRESRRAPVLESATLDELVDFFDATGRWHHLAAAWTPETIASLLRHDLGAESFGVIRRQGTIVAAGALWDQRRFRQTVVRGYGPALTWTRPLINAAGGLLGIPPLPRIGAVLPHAFLSPLAFRAGYDDLLPDLVSALRARAAAKHIDYVALALPSDDRRLPQLRHRFPSREYHTRLYRVHWFGDSTFALDSRPFLPDVALL